MGIRIPHLLTFVAATATFGCDDTAISQARPDVGGLPQDGGISGPLPLEVGMTFTYQGRLTARLDELGSREANSAYELTITITAIDDAAGTLEFSASGANTNRDDWDRIYDFNSWVGRVGPTLAEDQVGAQTVTVDLSAVPSEPPRDDPKTLPVAGPFFIDVRRIEELRTEFSQRYADGQPTVVSPDQTGTGTWRFSFTREDRTIITYNDQRRQMVLDYDSRGFLTQMTEALGQIDNPPSGDCRLVLRSGP